MFEKLRAAFREAVDNFNEELHRDEVPDAVDRLLRGMKDEVTEAKTRLRDLEEAVEKAEEEALKERRNEQVCARRREMAAEIHDDETARVADEYEEKHRKRRMVLEEKAEALRKELKLRRAEIEEMLDQIREARKSRDSLAAATGRTGARESLRDADDLFDELDRMAEKIGDEGRRREATDEILSDLADELDSGPISDPEPPVDLDARLAELKRRMGRED